MAALNHMGDVTLHVVDVFYYFSKIPWILFYKTHPLDFKSLK